MGNDFESEPSSSRGGRGPGARGRGGRGRGGSGRGGGRGGSSFGAALTDLPSAPREKGKQRGNAGGSGGEKRREAKAASDAQPQSSQAATTGPLAASLDTTTALEGETCFICAEPVKLYSIPPCNHKTCHICAIRLRVLYKKHDCTFCKAPTEHLIFTSHTDKDYLSFNAEEIPFKDERLKIHFETEQNRDETLVLLHFNCPDPTCDFAGASWSDLKSHVRSEHGKQFCDLCVRNSRIFAHEHTLYSAADLAQHIRTDHKHCEFCRMNFYSDDELYIHMRDRHEQCFICKRHEETRDDYHRDYAALEKHFKQRHYLCESKQCLEQKFVVFESEMDFKAHQVAEHGAELSSREKREALRVTANFDFHPNSSQARAEHGGPSTSSHSGNASNNDNNIFQGSSLLASGTSRDHDPLGVSVLASRSHVPGAGGPADHKSRRAQFGSGLTSAQKIKENEAAAAQKAAEEERIRRNQVFIGRVAEIVQHSEVKMHSFRTNLKTFQAGEMSARDLIDSIRGIVEDSNQREEVVRGLLNLLDSTEKKQALSDAWSTVQIEQTHFPSLGGGSSNAAQTNFSTITRGQVRTIKNSSVAANRGIWANVERAAASGGSVYRNVARSGASSSSPALSRTTGAHHFPSLSSNKSVVPGSALHSIRSNASARALSGQSSWGGSTSSNGRNTPTVTPSAAPASALPKPYSVDASQNVQRKNQTSIRSNSAAFPALPLNADATRLSAQKKALFAHKRSANNSGTATPSWSNTNVGRIDGYGGDSGGAGTPIEDSYLDPDALHDRLSGTLHLDSSSRNGQATPSSAGGGQKKNKQKQVLVSMGGVHRG